MHKRHLRHALYCSIAAITLTSCGDKTETTPVIANPSTPVPTSSWTPVSPDDVEDTKRPVQQKPPSQKATPSKPPSPLDTAISINGMNIVNIQLLDNMELIKQRDVIKYEACNAGGTKYTNMSKNEFSFEDYLTETEQETKQRLQDFKAEHKVSGDGPYRFKARIAARLGDYDFAKEQFDFTPISFDYLSERDGYFTSRCLDATEESGYIDRPAPLADEYHFYFDNKDAVQNLGMNKADAKALIDRMTAARNTNRDVKFEFVFEVPDDAFTFKKERYGVSRAEARAKITYGQVISVERDNVTRSDNDVLLAEYPETYFSSTSAQVQ